MKKINTLTALVFVLATSIFSQASDPLGFWPHHVGDVWQYRDASTNEIVYTKYYDSVWVSEDSSIFINGRRVGADINSIYEKIDTSFNVFNLLTQPNYPRYKLSASIGDSWVARVFGEDTIIVTVTDIYENYVFGILTTIKVFTFEIIFQEYPYTFWLGDDHLAIGFGLVFSFIEGGSAPYLAGAIIDSTHYGTIVSVEQEESIPNEFIFFQNYPNPFNPITNLHFKLPKAGKVTITVYDILGRLVEILIDEEKYAGEWTVKWNAENLSSGLYFAKLEFAEQIQVRKLLLTK
jgi:hypothetical protein